LKQFLNQNNIAEQERRENVHVKTNKRKRKNEKRHSLIQFLVYIVAVDDVGVDVMLVMMLLVMMTLLTVLMVLTIMMMVMTIIVVWC